MSFTTIKVEFGSQLRRLAFDSVSSSWTAVRSQLLTSYGLDSAQFADYALHYLDDEGDLISVNSDTEFAEAMRCAKQKGKILKLILSKNDKPTAQQAHTADANTVNASTSSSSSSSSSGNAVDQPQQSDKAALLSVAVDIHSDVEDVKVAEADVDDVADQQEEDMDLPLSRRDLLSKSPTLSEASDSSFVSINAQSLRDDLDGKDELAVEGANDSEMLSAVDDDVKEVVVSTATAATPSQPEFIASDRGVVQDVLKKLADDPIQLKSASPKAPSAAASTNTSIDQTDEKQAVLEPKANNSQDHQDEKAAPVATTVVSGFNGNGNGMKVKELRSSIEGIINEKFSVWLEDVLNSVDNLWYHEDEQMDRVQQLTARIRVGLRSHQQSLQRISNTVSKSMMRAMKVVEGKPLKPKNLKVKPLPMEEEQKTKAAAPTPIVQTPTVKASASVSTPTPASTATPSICCASSAVVVHRGIRCDGCDMSPICGVRFHCISCDQIAKVRQAGGFDLCESCESRGIHREVDGKVHVMIKIKQPTKVVVDVEAASGPIVGPQVYDVLRVNADGTRTNFTQPIPALAPASSSSSVSKEEKCSDFTSVAAAKVTELEQRIRSLEEMIKSNTALSAIQAFMQADANRKAEKQAEKEQKRKDKEERKRMKQEAAARAKAARIEGRKKMKEEKLAAKRASMEKTKAEAIVAIREQENGKQAEEKKDASEPRVKVENPPAPVPAPASAPAPTAILPSAPLATAAGAVAPTSVPAEKPANNTSTSAAASTTAAAPAPAPVFTSASAPAPAPAPAPVPFGFNLPQFPFSDMVNSITNTFSSATAPFAFGNQNNSKQPTHTQPAASAPFFPSAPTQTTTQSSSTAATASSSSSASLPSIWAQPLPTNGSKSVNTKRTLADVRAPAFFPYMVQLRDLESMGFDVDKSIHALRYYGGDIQKAINSML